MDVDEKSNVGAINNVLQSQFREYEFLINGQPIRNQNNCYAYWSFMKTLLTFNELSKRSLLKTQGWDLDTVDLECHDATEPANPGFYHRSKKFWESRKAMLFGPLLTDLYDCGSLLFPNSEYTIRLFRQPHAFSIMSHESGANYIINILKAELYVTKLVIFGSIPRSIKFTQSDARVISVPAAVRNVDAEVYQGELPRRVIILQVLSEAYNGSYTKNPFYLNHFKATSIGILVNGNAHPVENNMLTIDPTDHANIYHVAYTQLDGLGIGDIMMDLLEENFRNGTFFFPVNLDTSEKTGVMRLQIGYQLPVASAITIIVLGDFERRIEKDGSGKVSVI
jgi:hypothetical protein